MSKKDLINKITQLHPSFGVEKGYSWYVGGMKDTGNWYLDILYDLDIDQLKKFLSDCTKNSSTFKRKSKPNVSTQSDRNKPVIKLDGSQCFIHKDEMDNIKRFYREVDCELLNL